jgi:hypothetical protein
MSLAREGLRTIIRTTAAPALLIYIATVNWPKIKNKPGIIKIGQAYKKLWTRIKAYVSQRQEKHPDPQDDQEEWSYSAH